MVVKRIADKRPEVTGDTREKILTVALRAFAERGFDGARTRDIAERAGVNLGLITYYFGNKQGLWESAVDRAFEELRQGLQDALGSSGQPLARNGIERAIRAYVHFVAKHPEFVQLMQDESKLNGPRMRWLVDRHVRPIYDAIKGTLVLLQEQGLLPPMPVASFYYLVVGAAGSPFSQGAEFKRLTGLDPGSHDFVEAHADALIRLLLSR